MAKLTASDAASKDYFGYSVAIDGDVGLDVYHKDEADLRERALGSPICIVRGLLSATTDDEDPFALPVLRRDHGATKVKMVLQRPMSKPGWKLPPQTSALRTLGPYIDSMRRDLEENTTPDTSKPLEFAANVETSYQGAWSGWL